MKILNLITIFLLVSSAFGYPTKPLDERSTELAWQAWLLVDDQNQNKQNNEGGGMRKKVIAKSVFIVPTFNLDKLPPCAEGYTSDNMGRCLEVIRVDNNNQLQFLLSKLQSHIESSHKTSTGPEKFTIEIPENDSNNDNVNAALVFTQNPKSADKNMNNMVTSNGHTDLSKLKIEDKNPEEATETIISTPTMSISTETETITDPMVTEQVFSTVSSFGDEKLRDDGTMTMLPVEETTEMPMTFVTEDNRQAIFFRLPTTTTTTTTEESEQHPPNDFLLSSRIRFKDDAFSNDEPSTQDSTNLDYVSNSRVTFKQSPEASADLLTSENVRHTTNIVRFPDEHQHSPFIKHSHEHHHGPFNHRNRDRDFWRLKPSWKEPNEHNSLVVKLSNLNFNDLLVQNRHSSPMYRQIPSEHLSYIFGRRDNHR